MASNKEGVMRKPRQKRKTGFTLLELLMVVIIIAILASLALPQYLRTVAKARRSEALNVLATLRSAEQRYKAQASIFSDNFGRLDLDYSDASGAVTGNNMNVGSWTYDVSQANAASSINATGVTGTTVSKCVLGVDLSSGSFTAQDVSVDGVLSGSCAP